MNTCEDAPCCGCCPKNEVSACPDCGIVTDGSWCYCHDDGKEGEVDWDGEDAIEEDEAYSYGMEDAYLDSAFEDRYEIGGYD
jgi:hypothetical protein